MATQNQLLEIIHTQTEIAKLGFDLGNVMQFVVERTFPIIHADGAVIELEDGQELVYRAVAGIAKNQLGLRLKVDTSLSGLCLRTGEILSCVDSDVDTRVDQLACKKVGLRSMILIPLKYENEIVGVLKAISALPNKFHQTEIDLLVILSEVVAAAMFFSCKYNKDNLFYEATHDGMTGLGNRAYFMDRLKAAQARMKRDHIQFGLLMIDMDGLKQVNDTYGHRIGDALIEEFSKRLNKTTRITDTAARLGGDEFGILLYPIVCQEDIDTSIERIYSEITFPFIFEEVEYQLSASVGSAFVQDDSVNVEQLLEIADKSMYEVKNRKKQQLNQIN